MTTHIEIYDTTLRDGSQGAGVSFSAQDKLSIAVQLDKLGVDYIEGGFPLSNEKEQEFFAEAKSLDLKHARLSAFGSTLKPGARAESDPWLKALLDAQTQAVTIVAKSWLLHVTEVLQTTPDENLRMIRDTVAYMKKHGREVIFDAEHFFDGFNADPAYALKTLTVAKEAGADVLVLCDTNGGSLPTKVAAGVAAVRPLAVGRLGIHTHNDSDLATSNTLVAVEHGVRHVQGTINGLGERCGNADLCAVIPNLVLKAGYTCLDGKGLDVLTEVSRYVYELGNMNWREGQPFVGSNAFTHKGGFHVDAMQKNSSTYEHIDPSLVGNERRVLVSELSGRSTILAKTDRHGLADDHDAMAEILAEVQHRENEGYQYEAAEASFELLVKRILGEYRSFFELEGFRVIVEKNPQNNPVTEATLKIRVGEHIDHTVSEGDGPVNALDGALRKALEHHYPGLRQMHLVDYKVRVINPREGTAAKVRVVIESQDATDQWGTVGVSENVIEASWLALLDSVEYKLLKDVQS